MSLYNGVHFVIKIYCRWTERDSSKGEFIDLCCKYIPLCLLKHCKAAKNMTLHTRHCVTVQEWKPASNNCWQDWFHWMRIIALCEVRVARRVLILICRLKHWWELHTVWQSLHLIHYTEQVKTVKLSFEIQQQQENVGTIMNAAKPRSHVWHIWSAVRLNWNEVTAAASLTQYKAK